MDCSSSRRNSPLMVISSVRVRMVTVSAIARSTPGVVDPASPGLVSTVANRAASPPKRRRVMRVFFKVGISGSEGQLTCGQC